MKQVQHSQAFSMLGASTNPKIPVGDNRDGGYQLSLLSWAFYFRLCGCSDKKMHFICHMIVVSYSDDDEMWIKKSTKNIKL